MKIIKYWRI